MIVNDIDHDMTVRDLRINVQRNYGKILLRL